MLGHWLDSRFVFTVRLSGIAFVLYSTISQPLCRSTCVSWHHCLRTRTFCPSEGLLPLSTTTTSVQLSLFQDNLGKPAPERQNQSGFKWGERWCHFGDACSDISWTICKQSAPPCRQITMPTPHQFFTGWMPFVPPNQQRQSTEGRSTEGLIF